MADRVACLSNGRVVVIDGAGAPTELASPYAEQAAARLRARDRHSVRVVGVTRGRVREELCYAISTGSASGIFAQKPGSRDEQRLFHDGEVEIAEIDFSFADEAFTCTVEQAAGTSAIGVLADDGKGMRTVTEGDVLDRGPRWVPGGVGEIVYASAGIGRTRNGVSAGRTPFALHRLRLNDSTVEVLVADANYDYLAPVPVSASLIYAIRRRYQQARPNRSLLGALTNFFARGAKPGTRASAERMMIGGSSVELSPPAEEAASREVTSNQVTGYELVRITPKGTEVMIQGALAFDVAANGDIVYSDGSALYRAAARKGSQLELVASVARIEQIVIG